MSGIARLQAIRLRRSAERPHVVALHCSGGSARQWRHLAQALGSGFDLTAPDLIGSEQGPSWHGTGAFRLTDEARRIVSIVDRSRYRVHLVGHSYGGGVALRVAMERPHRIASLTLYEPTSFHVLRGMGPDGRHALNEIRTIASGISDLVGAGRYLDAAHIFVDYWNGIGTFVTLSGEARANVARFMPQAGLHFRALCEEGFSLANYRRLRLPLRIFSGSVSPSPAQIVAYGLSRAMNPGALRIIGGVGHMGPVTAPAQIATEMADHIRATDAAMRGVDQSWDEAA
jgi:pimeloyl-ACP methyl ester carboxylesterase